MLQGQKRWNIEETAKIMQEMSHTGRGNISTESSHILSKSKKATIYKRLRWKEKYLWPSGSCYTSCCSIYRRCRRLRASSVSRDLSRHDITGQEARYSLRRCIPDAFLDEGNLSFISKLAVSCLMPATRHAPGRRDGRQDMTLLSSTEGRRGHAILFLSLLLNAESLK